MVPAEVPPVLQHTETANTLDTCIRAILAPEGGDESFTSADCRIELARDSAVVRVEFPTNDVPHLTIGQRCRLQLDRGDDIEVFDAPAKAIGWRAGSESCTYELHVDNRDAVALADLVGARKDERVRVDYRDPVRAAISTSDGTQRREGHLFDLSRHGCAIVFEAEESWMLDHQSLLTVHLELFPGEVLIATRAQVRSRRVNGLSVVHGFLLDTEGDRTGLTDPALFEEQIERFLALRTREMEMRRG